MIARCPRCKTGAILKGECLQCGHDATIDDAALAEVLAELARGAQRNPVVDTRGRKVRREVAT